MKRMFDTIMVLAAILFCTTVLTGCAAMTQTPALGVLYTDVTAPVTATGNAATDKMLTGTATVKSYFGLIATGDASIATAAKRCGYHQDPSCRLPFDKYIGDRCDLYRDCARRIRG